jgi:predicted protein tyrosine phosphatase
MNQELNLTSSISSANMPTKGGGEIRQLNVKSSISSANMPTKGGGEIRQPTLSIGENTNASSIYTNCNKINDSNNNCSSSNNTTSVVENVKLHNNTVNIVPNFNCPALTSRIGIDETINTSRPNGIGKKPAASVTINNISAAANIMGETERRSLKLAAVEHECSEILPYLFVSGESVARNLKLLQSKGITTIINCAGVECKNCFENDFQYITIKLSDSKTARLDRYIYSIINEIETVRKNGGRVLIHCWQGVSRSVSFVVAYLMWKNNLNFENAKNTVRKVRNVARPNMGFQCQLMEWRRLRNETYDKLNSRLYALLFDNNISGIASNILPHLCLKENSSQPCLPHIKHLDQRGCFLLLTKGQELEKEEEHQQQACLYVWKGSECNSQIVKKLQEHIYNICKTFMENEVGATNAKLIYIRNKDDATGEESLFGNLQINDSSESDERHFWSCLGAEENQNIIEITKNTIYDTFWNIEIQQQEQIKLQAVDEENNRTNGNNNGCDDDGGGGEIALYKYTGATEILEYDNTWEHLYGYEWEDLGHNNASEDIFLVANKSKAYLFIGAKCLFPLLNNAKTSAEVKCIIQDMVFTSGSLSWSGQKIVIVMEQGGLSNEFCDFFEKGM